MHSLSIFGTGSDAGKSTISFVIGKLLQQRGYSVAPFKAQNVSNNSRVTSDGRELAIAQHFQASVLGVEPVSEMNPVLLKSGSGNAAALILNGKPVGDRDVRQYYRELNLLKPAVDTALATLREQYDILVCEGAGSPVELNLMDKDLANIYTADSNDNKIILVADIEKGGSFASIWGTINLLPEKLSNNIIGVIINKFRGDVTLYDKGIEIIEKQFGVPVLGVLPYKSFNLGFEDSQSLFNYRQQHIGKVRVGVIKLPHISNFNDFEPLIIDSEVQLEFVESGFDSCDILIIPGSKRTIYDLNWLKENGIHDKIKSFKGKLFAICGGYQMLFNSLCDEHAIEENEIAEIDGLGFIDNTIVFKKEKVLHCGTYQQFGMTLEGFEIHHGVPSTDLPFYEDERVSGTFLHGIFENDRFRTEMMQSVCKDYSGYNFVDERERMITEFVDVMSERLNMDLVESSLSQKQ